MAALKVHLNYAPNPKQKRAHALKAKYRGFCGGWGNGKTTWGCVEFFLRLVEYPGTNSMIFRKTRPELRGTTWDMMLHGDSHDDGGWTGIPRELIKTNNKSDLYIELKNGSRIHGAPLDDIKKLENYNLGLWWIDQAEEVGEDFIIKLHGRLRQHDSPREGLLTFNPDGHNHLWKRFIDPNRSNQFKQRYRCIEATTYDNPKLPDDYLEQFEGLPDHWVQRYIMGSHEVFIGQIFTDWSEELHVVQPFLVPSDWERWLAFDPGIRHEACAFWLARDPEGNCYAYREILETDQTVEWWTDTILDAELANDVGGPEEEIERRIIGPESRQRSQTDGKSVYDLFSEYGIAFEFSDRDPSARISRITEHLRPSAGHVHPWTGSEPAPRLYVFATCEKLREYLPQYRWRPTRGTFTDEHSPEAPRKKDDHNIDCLGHILVAMDDLPPLPDHSAPPDPEQRFLEEHFRGELHAAAERSVARGYSPGRFSPTHAVGGARV